MKFALLVIVSVIVIVSAADPSPCCSPDQMELDLNNWFPERKEMNIAHVAYDYVNKREASHGFVRMGEKHVVYHQIRLFNESKEYTIFDKQCKVADLHREMVKDCLPQDAAFKASVTIGGSLQANIFEVSGTHGRYKNDHFFASVSASGCVPIQNTFIDTATEGMDRMEFWNVQVGIKDPKIFEVPSICKQE